MKTEHKPLPLVLRLFLALLALTVLGALGLAAMAGWGVKYYNAKGPAEEAVTVIIPKGSGFIDITGLLEESGVIEHPFAFRAVAEVLRKTDVIKAGEYEFPAEASPREVLALMVDGRTVMHRLTVPEGLTTVQVLALVMAEDKLQGPVPTDVQEGELLPETYLFSRGDSRSEIVAHMRREMRNTMVELWAARRDNLPFNSPQEALTLASIVEKETSLDREYGLVASAFINRLRKGMRLQADPTVIYAVTEGRENLGRRLSRADLRLDSPYNTYKVTGLPPTPIANPGKKALTAVLNPPETDYIFFVATGTGGHNFAVTLREHNNNVNQFRRRLKQQRSGTEPVSTQEPPTPVVKEAVKIPVEAATP